MSEKLVSSTQGSHDSTHEGDAQVIPVFDIQEELKKLPDRPGVYIMHDAKDAIIYVGKAINLKRRVHQYFVRKIGRGPKIERMVEQIARFEYIVTDSELEALVLENNLIKEHRPKYNTLLKDDKTYPYIRVTVEEEYPRVQFTRKMKKDKSRYFGPFKSAWAVRDTIDLLRKLYKIRDCSRVLPRDIGQERPCLNYQIGQCDAPCQGQIGKEAYRENVDRALDFLNGNYTPVLKMLEEKMQKASEELNFEDAASYRDLRESVLQVSQKQKIDQSDGEDKDILAMAQDGQDAVVQVFFVRGGRLIGRDHYFIRIGMDEEPQEILSNFVKQFYAGTPFLPRELMLECGINDQALLEDWLSSRRGSRVYIRVPQRGTKEKLVNMARENAEIVLRQDRERIRLEEGRTIGAMQELASLLGIGYVSRLEAYDISNLGDEYLVGGMVVFKNKIPYKRNYRKFKIKTLQKRDDYACMREVIRRRIDEFEEKKDESFKILPDLILIDGGKSHVLAVEEVFKEKNFNIPFFGLVKDNNHKTRAVVSKLGTISIHSQKDVFLFLTKIQDEVHRFTISYQKNLHKKNTLKFDLTSIEGVGEKIALKFLNHYNNVEEIRNLNPENLSSILKINIKVATKIINFFKK